MQSSHVPLLALKCFQPLIHQSPKSLGLARRGFTDLAFSPLFVDINRFLLAAEVCKLVDESPASAFGRVARPSFPWCFISFLARFFAFLFTLRFFSFLCRFRFRALSLCRQWPSAPSSRMVFQMSRATTQHNTSSILTLVNESTNFAIFRTYFGAPFLFRIILRVTLGNPTGSSFADRSWIPSEHFSFLSMSTSPNVCSGKRCGFVPAPPLAPSPFEALCGSFILGAGVALAPICVSL